LSATEFVDYYDFLMVSPHADKAMLEWAVRLMLTRYGPKTPETADAAKYETTKAAYRALIDPVKRQAYDQLWTKQKGDPGPADAGKRERRTAPSRAGQPPIDKICVELEATYEDVRLQIKMRQAVLSALYDVLITNPRNIELGRAEVAKAIHCRIDDLEFPIWSRPPTRATIRSPPKACSGSRLAAYRTWGLNRTPNLSKSCRPAPAALANVVRHTRCPVSGAGPKRDGAI
jgi:DnaJ domain